MSGAHKKVSKIPIIRADAGEALGRLCPNLAQWPRSWRIEESDISVGQGIVEAFTPFLRALLDQRLADKTLRRHRDHLWLLGGEIIRRQHGGFALDEQPVTALILNLIAEDGGPLVWPRITESEQDSFDVTCRKLYRFLIQDNVDAPTAPTPQ